jgi:hypothetical protein
LYFGRHLWFQMATIANQNGRHMVQHVLLPPNIHFHWNLFIFEFLTIFFNFYIGGHFEHFKNKEHNFEWWSIFVSSFKRIRCTVWILHFLHLSYHGNGRHFEFVQPPKSCHTLRWIFLQSFMKFDERNPKKIVIPLFCFYGNCGKVCTIDYDFFGLSRSTRCGCCS